MNLLEATPATKKIIALFDDHNIVYQHVYHSECRTSIESAKARVEGGGELVIGAKAILMKVERKEMDPNFNVFVLPSNKKINSKLLKKTMKLMFPDFRSYRFASTQEMATKTGGLLPGTMPPFALPIFEGLSHLFVDESLLEHQKIGFNAACLTQSLIVNCQNYIQVASPTLVFTFSQQ